MEVYLKIDNISVVLGRKPVLQDVSLTARAAELTGIIGPNGAGKTTLLRAIMGLVPIRGGQLEVLGVSSEHIKSIRSEIGYMPQKQHFERYFPLSVEDVVATGLLSGATILKKVLNKKEKISLALESVDMTSFAYRPFKDLSGGEQQRVLLARALVRSPKLLLLDEPNSGLDYPAQALFLSLLQDLKSDGGPAILFVSHDLLSLASAADQLACINKSLHLHGRPNEVLQSPYLDEAYRCQFEFLNGTLRKAGGRDD